MLVSFAAYYCSPGVREWARAESIERYQGRFEAWLRRLNKNEFVQEDGAGLSWMWCWMVEQLRK